MELRASADAISLPEIQRMSLRASSRPLADFQNLQLEGQKLERL